jgi:hypothetical protein
MTPKKTITLNGQEVKMIYCTATENGYERLAGQSINAFFPQFGKDSDGNDIIISPAQATTADYITLAISAIVAAYAKDDQDPPIDGKYILYEATRQERDKLLTAIVELRNEWYDIPQVAQDVIKREAESTEKAEEADEPKNV